MQKVNRVLDIDGKSLKEKHAGEEQHVWLGFIRVGAQPSTLHGPPGRLFTACVQDCSQTLLAVTGQKPQQFQVPSKTYYVTGRVARNMCPLSLQESVHMILHGKKQKLFHSGALPALSPVDPITNSTTVHSHVARGGAQGLIPMPHPADALPVTPGPLGFLKPLGSHPAAHACTLRALKDTRLLCLQGT